MSQLEDLKQAKNTRFENLISHVESISTAKLARFDKLEAHVEEFRENTRVRLAKTDGVLAKEIEERRGVCADIVKKFDQEAFQWRMRCEHIEKTVNANWKQTEIAFRRAKERDDELSADVGKHAECLTNNSMAMDPFKHFTVNPFIPNSSGVSDLSTRTPGTPGSPARPWTTSSSAMDGVGTMMSPRSIRLPNVEGASHHLNVGSYRGLS